LHTPATRSVSPSVPPRRSSDLGDQDDSGEPRGRGGGQHGLGGADVVATAIGRPGLRRTVVGCVHQDVHALQASDQPWVAHVRDTPGDITQVGELFVDGDDFSWSCGTFRFGQPLHEEPAHSGGGTSDRNDRARPTVWAVLWANLAVIGIHSGQLPANVTVETTPNPA